MKSLRKIFLVFLFTAFISSFANVANACDCEHESDNKVEEQVISLGSDSGSEDVCLDCEACCVSHHNISQYDIKGDYFYNDNRSASVSFLQEIFKSHHIEVLKSPPKA